jgi:hypothetical protein
VDIAPFPCHLFQYAVLVPEIGTRLIQQDLNLSREFAIKVRLDSSEYGNAVFGDTEDNAEDDAGDKIMMHVSGVRRLEILATEGSEAAEEYRLGEVGADIGRSTCRKLRDDVPPTPRNRKRAKRR